MSNGLDGKRARVREEQSRFTTTLSTATGNEVFGSVLISLALLTPPNKQTNKTEVEEHFGHRCAKTLGKRTHPFGKIGLGDWGALWPVNSVEWEAANCISVPAQAYEPAKH
jgi:hypothetical protein